MLAKTTILAETLVANEILVVSLQTYQSDQMSTSVPEPSTFKRRRTETFVAPVVTRKLRRTGQIQQQQMNEQVLIDLIGDDEEPMNELTQSHYVCSQETVQGGKLNVQAAKSEHLGGKDLTRENSEQNLNSMLEQNQHASASPISNSVPGSLPSQPGLGSDDKKKRPRHPRQKEFKQACQKFLAVVNKDERVFTEEDYSKLKLKDDVFNDFSIKSFKSQIRSDRYRTVKNKTELDLQQVLGKRTFQQMQTAKNDKTEFLSSASNVFRARTKQIFDQRCEQATPDEIEFVSLFLDEEQVQTGVFEANIYKLNDLYQLHKQDQYIQNFLGLDKEGVVLPFDDFLPIKKVEIWLQADKYTEEIKDNLMCVGREIADMLAECSPEQIKLLTVRQFCDTLMKLLINSQVIGGQIKLSVNIMALLFHQGCLRNLLLADLEFEQTQVKGKNIKLTEVKDSSCGVSHALLKFLRRYLLLSEAIAMTVIDDFKKLVWENFMVVLCKSTQQVQLIKLCLGAHKSDDSPGDLIAQCFPVLQSYPWLFDHLCEQSITSVMDLQSIADFLQHISGWDRITIKTAIFRHGIQHLVANDSKATQVANVLQVEQIQQIEEYAAQIASSSSECQEIYQQVCNISLQWAKDSDGYYIHNSGTCLVAAKAISSGKMAVYSQLDPGNGKTYSNLLTCAFYKQNTTLTPVYVTLNPVLKQQVEIRKRRVKEDSIEVITMDAIQGHFDQQKVFVFDEFFSALTNERVRIDRQGSLNPIFQLGHTEKVIMSTGHRSEQTNNFLKKFFSEGLDLQINESLQKMSGKKQEYNLKVKAFKTVAEAKKAALKAVMEVGTRKPVICFGFTPQDGSFSMPSNIYIKVVTAETDIETVQDTCARLSLGIVFLPLEYAVGVDLRYKQDALVFVVSAEVPTPEDMKQMVARGTRSMGSYSGQLYTVGTDAEEMAIRQKLLQNIGPKYHDFIQNLHVIMTLRRVKGQRDKIRDLLASKPTYLRISTADFLVYCGGELTEVVMDTISKIQKDIAASKKKLIAL